MLIGVPKILNGELLKLLSDMGHGDIIALVDANYPASSMGRRVVEMPGTSATDVLEGITRVLPIDHISDIPAMLMAVEEKDAASGMGEPEIYGEFREIIEKNCRAGIRMDRISRDEFYARSKEAFAIIHTGEERLYGDLMLVKGVIG